MTKFITTVITDVILERGETAVDVCDELSLLAEAGCSSKGLITFMSTTIGGDDVPDTRVIAMPLPLTHTARDLIDEALSMIEGDTPS